MTKTTTQASAPVESLLGQADDEFTQRLNAGEDPGIEEYAARYPQIADAIRQVFPALRTLRPAPPDHDLPAQQTGDDHRLGDYRIIREIGRGGMGIVYDAQQISLGRRVALKVLPFAAVLDERQLQRFKNEAQAAAQLHHTNIVPVFSVGCERGVHYYAMQFIDGQTLAQVISELGAAEMGSAGPPSPAAHPGGAGPPCPAKTPPDSAAARLPGSLPNVPSGLSPGRSSAALDAFAPNRSTRTPDFFRSVATLGIQAAEALEHAHEFGIVHRDIKPSNLLLDQRGNLWITDFGLARLESSPDLTMTGDILGTLRYMSPEQAAGKNHLLDHRTDIYSPGVTLYELLTQEPAIDGRDRQELLKQIADHDPRPPRRLNPAIPADLETIVLKATAKEPQRRYASAEEFAADLENFLQSRPIQAKRPTLIERSAKWCRRHTAACVFGVALLTMTVIGLSIGTALLWREQARTLDALSESQEARRAEEVQRLIAEAEATRADRETAVAKAVNLFLTKDLLAAVAPSTEGGKGKDVLMRDVLDKAAERIEEASRAGGRFEKMPLVEASIRVALGRTYHLFGEYTAAETHLARAHELRLQELGEEHQNTLQSMGILALLYRDLNRYDEAQRLSIKVLQISKRVLGDEHRTTLSCMDGLANVYVLQGRYDEAEPLLAKALAIQKSVLGENHRDTLGGMSNLANVYVLQLRFDEAEPLLLETLGLMRRELGDEDRFTMNCTSALVAMCQAQRRYDDAEPLLVESLDIRKHVLGDEHPDTLSSVTELADLYSNQGRYDQAESLYLGALDSLKRTQGEEHLLTLRCRNSLAKLYSSQGRRNKAEPLFVKTLGLMRRVLGEENPSTHLCIADLAALYSDQKRYDEAEPLYVELLEIRKRVLGEDHHNTLATMNNLALLYLHQGRYDKAEPMFLERLQITNRVLREEHPDILLSMYNLALLYKNQRRYDEAETLFVKTLELTNHVLSEEFPDKLIYMSSLAAIKLKSMELLAAIYGIQGRMDDARPIVRALQEGMRRRADRPQATARDKNKLAWSVLTCRPADLRDPESALLLAQGACAMTGNANPIYLDTLALAQHLTGDTPAAIETARKALSLLPPRHP